MVLGWDVDSLDEICGIKFGGFFAKLKAKPRGISIHETLVDGQPPAVVVDHLPLPAIDTEFDTQALRKGR